MPATFHYYYYYYYYYWDPHNLLHLAQRQVTNETNFPINSYVLAKYENKKPSKFHTNLHGPYRIISKQRAVYTIYTVENLVAYSSANYY